jgi:hypothetical protein
MRFTEQLDSNLGRGYCFPNNGDCADAQSPCERFAMLEMASTCRVWLYSSAYGNEMLEPAHTGEFAALMDAGIDYRIDKVTLVGIGTNCLGSFVPWL